MANYSYNVPAAGNAITQNQVPTNGEGRINKMKTKIGFGGLAFTGLGAYFYHKEGDSYPVAIGKSLLTNAAWSLMPGGLGAMIGLTAVQMAPEIGRALDMKRAEIGSRSVAFGGGFTQNAAQQAMQQIGIQNIMNARSTASAIMSRHAQGAVKAY